MDLNTVTVNSATALIQYILAPATLVFILVASFICWRSGSLHTLLLRLWSTFAGKTTIKSEIVGRFAADELDLTHFRFFSWTRVATLRDAERLILWAYQFNISISLIRACRHHFDVDKPGPKLSLFQVRNRHLIIPFVLFLILSGCLTAGIISIFYDRAVIRMKATGNFFSINDQYISPFPGDEKLFWRDCANKDIAPSIAGADREQFCAAKVDAGLVQSIRENVRTQQSIGLLISFEVSIALWAVMSAARTIHSAKRIRNKLNAAGAFEPHQAEISVT